MHCAPTLRPRSSKCGKLKQRVRLQPQLRQAAAAAAAAAVAAPAELAAAAVAAAAAAARRRIQTVAKAASGGARHQQSGLLSCRRRRRRDTRTRRATACALMLAPSMEQRSCHVHAHRTAGTPAVTLEAATAAPSDTKGGWMAGMQGMTTSCSVTGHLTSGSTATAGGVFRPRRAAAHAGAVCHPGGTAAAGASCCCGLGGMAVADQGECEQSLPDHGQALFYAQVHSLHAAVGCARIRDGGHRTGDPTLKEPCNALVHSESACHDMLPSYTALIDF